jgi:hypothetical protein
MKKVITTEEYDGQGYLIKRTVTTEEDRPSFAPMLTEPRELPKYHYTDPPNGGF